MSLWSRKWVVVPNLIQGLRNCAVFNGYLPPINKWLWVLKNEKKLFYSLNSSVLLFFQLVTKSLEYKYLVYGA